MITQSRVLAASAAAVLLSSLFLSNLSAQRAAGPAPVAPTGPMRLEIVEGSLARYRVREQLAGISFPSEVLGTTNGVTGAIVLKADGAVDPAQSKITVDLRGLKTDQDQRDGFVAGERLLQTDKFPNAEFVPKRVVGLASPVPNGRGLQGGFQMIGDMTLRGVTKEVTWNTVATFNPDLILGKATTEITFEYFSLPKPMLARVLSVGDMISLELVFRLRRMPIS